MGKQVTAEVVVTDGHLSGRGRTTLLRLSWQTNDPLAVRLLLAATPDHPSLPRGSWVILRDFLRYGCDEPTGDGEVRIRPDASLDRVRFDLAGEWGGCWVTMPRQVLNNFLDATEELIPTGSERSEGEVDALIARLLIDG